MSTAQAVQAAPGLVTRIATNRAALADAAIRAGMGKDEIRHVFDALGTALDLFGEGVERLEKIEAAKPPLTEAEIKLVIGQISRRAAIAVSAHIPEIMAAARWRYMAFGGGFVLLAFAAGCFAPTLARFWITGSF